MLASHATPGRQPNASERGRRNFYLQIFGGLHVTSSWCVLRIFLEFTGCVVDIKPRSWHKKKRRRKLNSSLAISGCIRAPPCPSPFQPPNAPIGAKDGRYSARSGCQPDLQLHPALGTGSRLRRQLRTRTDPRIRLRSGLASRGEMKESCSSPTPCWDTTGLTVPLVDTSNGIGAILGGGMDLNLLAPAVAAAVRSRLCVGAPQFFR